MAAYAVEFEGTDPNGDMLSPIVHTFPTALHRDAWLMGSHNHDGHTFQHLGCRMAVKLAERLGEMRSHDNMRWHDLPRPRSERCFWQLRAAEADTGDLIRVWGLYKAKDPKFRY